MKLLNYKIQDNNVRFGVLWNNSEVVDIKSAAKKMAIEYFENFNMLEDLLTCDEAGLEECKNFLDSLVELQKKDVEKFSKIKNEDFHSIEKITYLAPIYNPQKIICLGRSYAAHAKEGGAEVPKSPMIWGKFNSAIIAHKEYIELPKISEKVDVEIEFVVVIGKEGKHIPEEKAFDYIAGYTIGNDVTARDYQYTDKQFTRAKTMDTFSPLGPWIVTKDEISDPQNLSLELKVNGKTWQKSNTKDMIFTIPFIISHLSKSFTFKAGDIIFTGTPEGVGHYQKPPVYLKEGDNVTLTIEQIGTLENPVTSEK